MELPELPRGATRVKITPWEYAIACFVATGRCFVKWFEPDRGHYRNGQRLPQFEVELRAAICELATAKFLGLYWPGHFWMPADPDAKDYRKLADVGESIEVRSVVRIDNPVWLRERQTKRGLFVVGAYALPDFREVYLLGWRDHDAAWAVADATDYADSRTIPTDKLRPMAAARRPRSDASLVRAARAILCLHLAEQEGLSPPTFTEWNDAVDDLGEAPYQLEPHKEAQ